MGTEVSQPLISFIVNIYQASDTKIHSINFDTTLSSILVQKNREDTFVSRRFFVSGLPYLCDVKEAFKRVLNIDDLGSVRSASSIRLTEAGSAVHTWFQNHLLSFPEQSLWGNWRCLSCGQLVTNSFKPAFCRNKISISSLASGTESYTCRDRKIGKQQWAYEEIRVSAPDYDLSGKLDGIIFHKGKWYVLELKSTTEFILNQIKKVEHKGYTVLVPNDYNLLPMPMHVEQASVYNGMLLEMIEEGRFPLDKSTFGGAWLVYVSRESLNTKTFALPASNKAYNYYKNRLNNIKGLVESKNPLHGQKKCKDRQSTHAKTCPFRDNCFPLKKRQAVTK